MNCCRAGRISVFLNFLLFLSYLIIEFIKENLDSLVEFECVNPYM